MSQHSVTENDDMLPMMDITEPDLEVQVNWTNNKKTLYVHVDGQTVLRICKIPSLKIGE